MSAKANILKRFAGATLVAITLTTSAFAQAEPMSTQTAMEYFTANELHIGVNVGNSLDAWRNWETPHEALETAWGNVAATQSYFNAVAAHGFKLVRIPVTYIGKVGNAPNYTIDAAWLARVAQVVDMANNAGLKVIINIHHDGAHGDGTWLHIDQVNPSTVENHQITQRFVRMWEQIATHFRDYGDYLMFQAFNELHDGSWGSGTPQEWQVINHWNQRFTNAVRGTGGNNERRYLLYYGYNTHASLAGENRQNFTMPTDPISGNGNTRQIVGFHFYDPFSFAHDGESATWDTPQNRAHITTTFANFKNEFVNNNIPVIIGECGPGRFNDANNATAHANRLAYIDFMYGEARKNGITPIYWETGADNGNLFSLFPRHNGVPHNARFAEVVEAMIAAVGGEGNTGGDNGGGGGDAITMLDDFEDDDAVARNGEPWYIYTMGTNTTIGNARDDEGYYIVKTNLGYAELFGINTDQSGWGDFSGAAIALETKDNGTVYDFGDGGTGFTYKYRGSAHVFTVNMEHEGFQVSFVGVTGNSDGMVAANDADTWNTVTITDFTRDIYDGWCAANAANAENGRGGSCTTAEAAQISLDWSKINALVWTVRGFNLEDGVWTMTGGKLELDDVAIIGNIDFSEVTSIAEIAREVPPSVETVIVVPPMTVRPAVELTAGPNPADRQSGAVNFYVNVTDIKSGTLSIYDASGNFVRRLSVNDPTVAWDLRDARGRLVSDGSYLVRGQVTTASGERERVSVLVGVR